MEVLTTLILVSPTLILLFFTWKFMNWVWIKPKKMEKTLRAKGFKGNSYRFLIGDSKETENMDKEAMSKPMNFNHDIIPRVLPFINNLIQDYGKKTLLWMGPTATVIIMEPDQIREILANSYVYQKPPVNPIAKLLVRGLITYDKDKWTKHRRLINPAFNLEKLKLMLPAFHLSCSDTLSKWEMIASEKQAPFELDVQPYIQTLSCDAISRTAFGSNYEEGKRIFELQKQLTEHMTQMFSRINLPGMMYLPTKKNKRMKALSKEIQTSIMNIVNKRLKEIQENESNGDDLLGLLLESNLNEIKEQGNKNSGMNYEEVIDECKLFYFAGQETTSTLLVWTLILLGKYVDWQDRARDEINQIFGEKNKPDYEGLNRLKVMNMILNEVQRLYPSAVTIGRMIYEDTILGDQILPAGLQFFLPTILLHHDENIWGADVNEFKPERFSEGVSKATKGQHVYFPFSSGPRVCIGQNFAMLEAKMALCLIIQSFSFETSALYAHAPSLHLTLQPQHGAQLVLRKL